MNNSTGACIQYRCSVMGKGRSKCWSPLLLHYNHEKYNVNLSFHTLFPLIRDSFIISRAFRPNTQPQPPRLRFTFFVWIKPLTWRNLQNIKKDINSLNVKPKRNAKVCKCVHSSNITCSEKPTSISACLLAIKILGISSLSSRD